jgi:hypothetical protein
LHVINNPKGFLASRRNIEFVGWQIFTDFPEDSDSFFGIKQSQKCAELSKCFIP